MADTREKHLWKQQEELLEAFRNRDKDKVVTLLKNTEKPGEIRYTYNETLLHYAAYHGWTDVCQLLVEQYQVDPHVKSSSGWTALEWACEHNHTDAVKYLVSHTHCDPLMMENKYGRTPLSMSYGETRHFLQEIIDQSKKEGFARVPDYTEATLQERQSVLDEAIAEGEGDLFQCNIVIHGHPGAGKSSVKAVILGKPPRPKHRQTATDIVENCVRTIKVDRVAANQQCFEEVDNDDIIKRISADVEKYRKRKKITKAQDQPLSFYSTTACNETIHKEKTFDNVESNGAGGIMSPNESPSYDYPPSPTETVKLIRVNLINFSSSYKSVFDSRWLHFIDSGGQPQFLDVFPLMHRSPNSHFVVVMRLTDGLDGRPKVRFYIEGIDEYYLPDHLVLSNREMIIRMCQTARRISRATGGKFTPRVFVVGTHNDQLLPIFGPIRRRSINSELLHIHEEYEDVLVCKTPGEQVMFMMNAMATGKERQQHMEELQRHILSATKEIGGPVKILLQWLILQIELEKCADVVRIEKCLELAGKIGMKEESVRAALEFLNKAALILYYPDDVPDLVITKMDPFTSRLSKLIKASFIVPDNGQMKESNDLRQNGIFKKSFLQRVFHDVADNLISDEEFLKLLESLKIAVHIEGDEYFLPSALSLKPPSGHRSSFRSKSNPLALLWDELILPHGFFLTVSVELQDKTGGEEGYIFELRKDEQQWRGAIQFNEVNGQIPGVVMLTDRQRWIEVAYSGDSSYCPIVYRAVSSATHRAIERLRHTGIDSPTVGLTCPLCTENDHYCTISKDRRFITCSNDISKTCPVTANILCWFEGGVLREGQAIGCDKEQAKQSVHDPALDEVDGIDDLKDTCMIPVCCDLSCEVSVSSPSIDRQEYGLSIDIDHSSLHPSSRYVANIQVHSEPDQFSFPMGSEPLSAVYSISLSDLHSLKGNRLSIAPPSSTPIATPHQMVLRIMHFADPNDDEQLNQLTFAKMSDHSESQFEIVPGGSFRPGDRFGEIELHHTSLWTIVRRFINRGPPLYRGVVLYTQTSPIRWTMHLLVSKYKPKQMIALNEYMKNEYGSMPGNREPDFLFKFKELRKLKMITKEEMNENKIISINGWSIAFDIYEISQEMADHFEDVYGVPGRCTLKIETQNSRGKDEEMRLRRHLMEKQPIIELSGIDSDKKYIRIDPPIGVKSITKTASSQDENAGNLDQSQPQQITNLIINTSNDSSVTMVVDSPLNKQVIERQGDQPTVLPLSQSERSAGIRQRPATSASGQKSRYKKSNGLQDTDSTEPPTVNKVFKYLQPHSTDWDRIGTALNVEYSEREDLRVDVTLTAERRLEKVIDKWIQAECSPITWDHLLEVLQRLGYNSTRRKIESIYTGKDYSSAQVMNKNQLTQLLRAKDFWKVVAITSLSALVVLFIAIYFISQKTSKETPSNEL